MPDPYMPDVKVEIAFNAGYTTPASSRTWTDVSQWVELADGIGIDHGRQDERSTADANSLTLTLDNSDGRFTAQRAASPYYPNVKIGRPIRVTATPPGGTASTRFVGFIDEWPVEWDGTDSYAMARIRATSRLARLGLSARLRSMPEEAILADQPAGYWTLGDPQGSTAATESSGNAAARLESVEPASDGDGTPVVFGNAIGVPTDGLTAAEFAGYVGGVYGENLKAPFTWAAGPRSVRAAVRLGDLANIDPAFGGVIASTFNCALGVAATGRVNGTNVTGTPTTVGPSINDGATHDLVCVRDGTNEILYVDGVAVATAAASAPGADTLGVSVGGGFPGTISHVAVYDRALAAAEVAAQYEAMRATFTERTDQRAARILDWAGVAATEVTTETGAETMTYQQTSGQSVVDALRDVESTEGGVLFDGRGGLVTLHNRSRRYLATVAATFDMAAQHVGSDYAPKLDRTTLTNDATVENPTTGETARSVDMASVDEYGVATASAKSVASTYDPLQQKAAWLVYSYAEPRPRVPSLTVDVLAHQGLTPSAQTILGLDVGALVAVTNQPTQADATSVQYFIEGYTESIGPESYQITYNLSPSHPSLSTFVIGDSVRGALDSSYVLGL
jgi:hypothetical protein